MSNSSEDSELIAMAIQLLKSSEFTFEKTKESDGVLIGNLTINIPDHPWSNQKTQDN